MKDLVRRDMTKRRSMRRRRLVVCVVAVAAAVAGTTGTAGAEGDAGSPGAHFRRPRLARGVLAIEGTEAIDEIALRLQAGRPDLLEVDIGDDGSSDFRFKREKIATISVDASLGDDLVRIDEANGTFTDSIPTRIDGGGGSDTIAGGKGVETLLGGDGNDSIDGNAGNDVASMGAGDDVFVWDPGDGSDVVEGDDGADTMVFNGAGAAETVDVSANGGRLRFFRNPGTVTMDTDGVERVAFNALGGGDSVTVADLTATDVSALDFDLAGTLGGAAGDGQADQITVNATDGDDTLDVSGDPDAVKVSGLAATVRVLHPEVAGDRLDVNTLAGTDTVDSGALAAGTIQLAVDGVLVP